MRIAFACIVLSWAAHTCFGQKSDTIHDVHQLTDSIQKLVEQDHIVGLMLGIVSKDSILFSGGFGYADLENGRRVNEKTLFRLGSISKMFVSLGIMKLVGQGKLSLLDELKTIAPEVPFKNSWEPTNPVRIIHLLDHTSGFDDIKLNSLYTLRPTENTGINMVLVHKNSLVSRWKPGERFAYSNPNYSILGYIIEKLSGKPYHVFLKETILDPLKMKDTNFNTGSKFPEQDVKEYIFKNGKIIRVPSVSLLSGPQGALWSCAEDMIKFLKLFIHDGAPLFSEQVIQEMETPHNSMAIRIGLESAYGLGNSTEFHHANYALKGHTGLAGTCYSGCYYNRALDIGFVISSNSNANNQKIETLLVSFLEQGLPARHYAHQPLDLKRIEPFLGYYQFESPRNEIKGFLDKFINVKKIYVEDGQLYIKSLFDSPMKLVQTSSTTYSWENINMPMITFEQNSNGINVMYIGGIYFRERSSARIILTWTVILTAMFFLLTSFVFGFSSVGVFLIRRKSWRYLLPRILPMLATALLLWTWMILLGFQAYTYKMYMLGSVNIYTVIIFFGPLSFGIISVANAYFTILQLKKGVNLTTVYFLALSLSMLLITGILLQNGLLGLRTWAM